MKTMFTTIALLISVATFAQEVSDQTKSSLNSSYKKLFKEGAILGVAGTACNAVWFIAREKRDTYPEGSKQWNNSSITSVTFASAGIFMTMIGCIETIQAGVEAKRTHKNIKAGITHNGFGISYQF